MFCEPSVVERAIDLLEFLETGETGGQLLVGLGLEAIMVVLRGNEVPVCSPSAFLPILRVSTFLPGRCRVIVTFAALISRASLLRSFERSSAFALCSL